MKRAAGAVAVMAAAVVAAGAIALLLSAREGDVDDPRPRQAVAVTGRILPPAHAFGEGVIAEVAVVVDRTVVDPDTVVLRPRFTPYDVSGPVREERAEAGAIARIRLSYPLSCLREGCAPDGGRRTVELPLTELIYGFEGRPGRGGELVEWPRVEVVGRVGEDALAQRAWRADVSSAPAASYRAAPGVLAGGLLGGSVAFALLAAALAWRLTLRRPVGPVVDEDDRTAADTARPIELALAVARDASRDGDNPERRKALERAARELALLGRGDLADRARTLAWSAHGPSAAAVEELARDVAGMGDRGAR